ncbi:TLC domain-containing protein 5-like [Patiria miniata]|uniref:TLC domain-containing protein n=1 Tax=Patiria miniata TaxID=46514 RepID=A0A914AQY2_PATMI|nr:TLC domain-containing protein 5-like [Patiria miniata]XP_038066063.1 TLC domain-containing protein 5-like [Patiria miniata]
MEMSASTISLLVISSCVFWSSLYGLFCYLCPQRSYEWNCRAVTLVHAVTIVVMSYIFGIYYNPWPFTHPGGKSSIHEVYTMVVCVGYFIFDFVWCVWFRDQESSVMLVHHLITIVGILAALAWEHSGTEVGATIFGAELSNPLLQMRWFMRQAGWKGSFLYEVNDFLFLLTFTVCRIGLGSYFLYCELLHPLPRMFFKVGAVALYLVSWVLMVNILVFTSRKYTKMYHGWTGKTVDGPHGQPLVDRNSTVHAKEDERVRMRNGYAAVDG